MWVVLGLGESAAGGAGINLQGDLLVCVVGRGFFN